MELKKKINFNKPSSIVLGLVCFFINYNPIFSQDAAVLDWVYQTYGTGSELSQGIGDIIIDNDDNIYVSGGVGSGTIDLDPDDNNEYLITGDNTNGIGFIAKYSPNGFLLWAKELQIGPWYMVVDNDGNLYTSGHFNIPIDFDPSQNEYIIEPDSREMYIAKYDNEGNFLWVKTTETQGSSATETTDLAISSETDRVTVSGTFWGAIDVNPDENENHILSTAGVQVSHAYSVTYDLEGEFIWATDFYVQNMISTAREYQGIYDNNGNLFLSGQFADTLQLDLTENTPPLVSKGTESHQYDAFIAKFNLLGELDWVIGLHGPERIETRDITLYDDNLYAVGMLADEATFYSSLKTDSIEIPYNLYPRPYVAKYNIETGDIDWAFDMKVTDNSWGGGNFITADINGCYISGTFGGGKPMDFNPDPDNQHLMTNNSSSQETFLAKYASDGSFSWAFSTPGGVFTEPRGLEVLSDDRVVLAGSYRGNVDVSGYGSGDSISSYFTSSINHHVFMGIYKQGMLSTNEVTATDGISLYPNPATDKQIIKLSGHEGKNAKITLYDIQGRSLGVVHKGKLEDETVLEFNVSGLSNGFYLYDVRMETERRTLRFIKK